MQHKNQGNPSFSSAHSFDQSQEQREANTNNYKLSPTESSEK